MQVLQSIRDEPRSNVYYLYRCIQCGGGFEPTQFHLRCPKCNGLFMVERDEERIDWQVGEGQEARNYFDAIRWGRKRMQYPNDSGVFMWLSHLLPGFPGDLAVSFREGPTDLFEIPDWLKKQLGLQKLFIKMEGQLPSKSFKDRGMAVAVSETRRLQMLTRPWKRWNILCASTGDTSASAAIYAAYARDRLRCIVIIPDEGVSPEQLFQARAAGATIISVQDPGGFDTCMRLAEDYCSANPETVMVNSENPLRIVGQETIALEICQDLEWEAPDWIAIPCGNGGNLTALMVSLLRMRRRGLIRHLPGILVAQAELANTLVRWGRSGFQTYEPRTRQLTVASAMNIQNPVSFPRIRILHLPFNLHFYDVPEESIIDTRSLFMSSGADICPQTAVALHAVLQARQDGTVRENDTVVAISTAAGVKFVDKEKKSLSQECVIRASLNEMDQAINEMDAVVTAKK